MLVGRVYAGLASFSLLFSVLFCFFCSVVDTLLGFWFFLELCGLSIIPCFFYSSGDSVYGFYSSLLTYVIVSGLSSVLLVVGILFFELYYFVFIGFLLKFGLFPFSLWLYRVFSCSNWLFIFFLSVILKFPILFFCFLFQGLSLYFVYGDCILTLVVCSFFFWFFSCDWEFIWCHMSLSSVATLFAACFCSKPEICFFIYFYFFLWGGLCILYFCHVGDDSSFENKFWWFCFLLLITPFSLPLFYKLSVCIGIFCSSFYLLVVWGLYSFSEQYFLYKLSSNYFYSGVYNLWVDWGLIAM
uniref:NADH dehydrogenase subunit 2 n=1 Tax=Pseudanoplocephala crawfordi TaxID=1480107 RepID=A0A0U2P669_9CEST|nr:NADH dehydrogenase subunit 2 [Pseudanoplocephala crawfordi]ALJ78646.1 NADH dehydrogenase subunit 2 [Pseudanoplocephala crawfordi]